jgi:hypothetical protein
MPGARNPSGRVHSSLPSKESNMKFIRVVCGVTTVVVMFCSVSAGASAAVFTSSPGVNLATGSEFFMTLESSVKVKAGFAEFECTEGSLGGSVETNSATSAGGALTTLTFSNCGSGTVDTLKKGSISVASGGAVTGYAAEITFSAFLTSCVYGWTGTPLGVISSGGPATQKISGTFPKISGGFLCANPATWTAAYKVTKPSTLHID